jgi:hypothetical protein
LRHAQSRIAELEAELSALREVLEEKNRTTELLQADLKRYRYAYNVGQPNCPERVPKDQLQLAFERVLECIPPANDVPDAGLSDTANLPSTGAEPSGGVPPRHPAGKRNRNCREGHGRRNLDLSNLPIETARRDPPEVIANPEAFEQIGEERSSRVGFRPASYVRFVLIRTKWVPVVSKDATPETSAVDVVADDADHSAAPSETTTVVIAPLPSSVLPHVMADPSAIANIIVSKYDDVLPLDRMPLTGSLSARGSRRLHPVGHERDIRWGYIGQGPAALEGGVARDRSALAT